MKEKSKKMVDAQLLTADTAQCSQLSPVKQYYCCLGWLGSGFLSLWSFVYNYFCLHTLVKLFLSFQSVLNASSNNDELKVITS